MYVTRNWINKTAENLVDRFHQECGYTLTKSQYFGILTVLTEKGDLEDLLISLGIKIKEEVK